MTDIEKLKLKDSATIERLYVAYKSSFLAFCAQHQVPESVGIDVYQDAIIALIENAQKGKLDFLKADIKTYLFSIGKYMIYAKNRKLKAERELVWEHEEQWEELDARDEQVQLIEKALEKLGEACYKILRMFYYENKKLDELLQLLPYESKDVLKSQKARCIRQLRKLISTI